MTTPRVALLGILALVADAARATVFTPITTEELARRAVAVVTGRVERITAVQARDGNLYTLVRVHVGEVLKGGISTRTITLKEDGGIVGPHVKVVYGTPRFRLRERILLFLSRRPDGTFKTSELALGKFGLERNPQGVTIARRHFDADSSEMVPPGMRPLSRALPLAALRADVVRVAHVAQAVPVEPLTTLDPYEPLDAVLTQEITDTLPDVGPPVGRFHEADEGIPIAFVIDETQDSFLAPGATRQVWFAAMAAWTNVPTASVVIGYGDDGDPTLNRSLSFEARSGCGGVAGVGGWIGLSDEAKVFGGRSYARIINAFATVFADDPPQCPRYNQCNVAEVATHEIGHALGLRHSVDITSTMAGGAHHDCRCASLGGDDAAVLSSLYPLARPPTITTPASLPDATAGAFYQKPLAAIGGSGTFSWEFARPEGWEAVDDFGSGLTLSTDGLLSGVPSPSDPFANALIKATDTNGDSHAKFFTLRINAAGDATTTTIVTTTTTSTAIVPDPGEPIPCETTTTSTLPSSCDLASGFSGVSCKVDEGQSLVKAFVAHRARAMRLLKRIENRSGRASEETVKISGNLAKAARLLGSAERTAQRLVRLSDRPRFVGAVGAEDATALGSLGDVLVSRLHAIRGTLSTPAVPGILR